MSNLTKLASAIIVATATVKLFRKLFRLGVHALMGVFAIGLVLLSGLYAFLGYDYYAFVTGFMGILIGLSAGVHFARAFAKAIQ